MSAIYVTLKIVHPDAIDADTQAEIAEAAEPHDDDGGLKRWLGDHLHDAEAHLNDRLPEGWYVKVYEMEAD